MVKAAVMWAFNEPLKIESLKLKDPRADEVVVKVAAPLAGEVVRLGRGSVLVGFLRPLTDGGGVRALAASGVTAFALEVVPRVSRAQSMDALSSQSNVVGYRAALLGAQELGRFFPLLMTAAGTGRRAPVLVTEDAVRRMKPGSVVVDLAGEAGGNCALSVPGEVVVRHGVKILAPLNVPSTMAEHASQLYARNIEALLGLMVRDGELVLDFGDEVLAGACVTRGGEIVHEGARAAAAGAGASA